MSKRRILQSLSVACSAASLISCAPVKDGAVKLAKNTENIVGCQSFSDDFYDELYRFPLDQKEFPSTRELSEALDQTMRDGRLKDLSEADRLRLRDLVSEIYSILSEDVPLLAEKSGEATITVLSAIELGDRTTPEKVEIQDKLKEKLAELDAFTSDLKKAGALACTPAPTPTPGNSATPAPGSVATPTPTPTPAPVPATDTLFERWKATRHPVVYGALKTISVAYQSCSAGLSKALDSDTPSLKGISIVGTHSDGVGSKREISSLDQLISSQPYLQSYVKPVNGTNCFDVRANPMIYDYGGKPYTTSDQESTFNLFKNAGSGTSVLGIDCSAYVYVSLASAGFKVKASGRLKAIGASGISSSMYANPEGNGLTCLQHASFETTSSLK
ncbi:MAG TPA: hypothetical protein VM432_14630, partial [Bdellovibrionales bacterium]|nr:hypothetical protein [Bdellovibrionales bacterium]